MKEPAQFCAFEREGKPLLAAEIARRGPGEFVLTIPSSEGLIQAALALHPDETAFAWTLEVQNPDLACRVHFPFLDQLTLGTGSRWVDFDSQTNLAGQPLLKRPGCNAPLAVSDGRRSLLILQEGELVEGDYTSTALRRAPGLRLAPSVGPRQVYQGRIVQVEGGWRETFAALRAHLRAGLDLAEYRRADLQWYSAQLVQHFTFLYGREILDLERGEFDLERFLDEGERDFGGYDGFLVWGVYPRIGVDERTQWEFYDDLPGGREGLKSMSRRARQRGVRFFLPYLPWDRSAELHGRSLPPDEEMLAQLIADTEADGVFLDTLDWITPAFRRAIDRVKPGVVFCSEGRTSGKAAEIVTGGWEQSPTRDDSQGNWSASRETLPGIDLGRFILPEQRLFTVNRHATGDERLRVIRRGFLNGMGWVVWQDVFGLVLPYSPAEAVLLKKCRTIFRENLFALNSPSPTPCVETGAAGIYANEFPSAEKRMWTFYNEREVAFQGEIPAVRARAGFHLVDAWNRREAQMDAQGCLFLEIGPSEVGCAVEYPRMIEFSPTQDALWVRGRVEGARLLLQLEGEQRELPAGSGAPVLLPTRLARGEARLVKGSEVLDWIFLSTEPRRE